MLYTERRSLQQHMTCVQDAQVYWKSRMRHNQKPKSLNPNPNPSAHGGLFTLETQ